MSVSIPPEFGPFVSELVANGDFKTPEDVVRHALAQMKGRQEKFEELKASIDEAVAELDRTGGTPLDFDEIKQKARERLADYRAQQH